MGRRLVETCLLAFLEKKLIQSTEEETVTLKKKEKRKRRKEAKKEALFLLFPIGLSQRSGLQCTKIRTRLHPSARQTCQASSSCQPWGILYSTSTVHSGGGVGNRGMPVSGGQIRGDGDIQTKVAQALAQAQSRSPSRLVTGSSLDGLRLNAMVIP